MPKAIRQLIDSLTMYKLLLYYLLALIGVAAALSAFGVLGYNPLYIVVSAGILVFACWFINGIFSAIFDAPTNTESSIITGLILALIITPVPTMTNYGLLFILAAAGLAMASKYLLTIRRKHLFNPAAIAVVLTALGPHQAASWWIGTAIMLPFVVAGGLLLAAKIQRMAMVNSFFAAATVATIVYSVVGHTSVLTSLHSLLLTSPLFFLGYVMLTEPLTSPPTRATQNVYAVIVGLLLPPQAHILSLYSSPELALIVGNLFAYLVSPKTKLFPILKDKYLVAAGTVDFVFDPGTKLTYRPGQYMEWTLPHEKVDLRGNRRYFTLASSPTERRMRIGVKFYEDGSSYKKALLDLDVSTPIVAAQVAGDFVMPRDQKEKLAFIAGGIGITPFRSMVKYLIDTDEHRSISLLYSVRTTKDIAYGPLFEEARGKIGIQTTYVLTSETPHEESPAMRRGPITAEMIRAAIPDYRERTFYLSGTHGMVIAIHEMLNDLGVPGSRIKTDFFPGYA